MCPRLCGRCLCCGAARSAGDAHWAALAERTQAMALLGDDGWRLLCWRRARLLWWLVLCALCHDLTLGLLFCDE